MGLRGQRSNAGKESYYLEMFRSQVKVLKTNEQVTVLDVWTNPIPVTILF